MPVKNSKIGKLINKGERHFKNKQFEDAWNLSQKRLKPIRKMKMPDTMQRSASMLWDEMVKITF